MFLLKVIRQIKFPSFTWICLSTIVGGWKREFLVYINRLQFASWRFQLSSNQSYYKYWVLVITLFCLPEYRVIYCILYFSLQKTCYILHILTNPVCICKDVNIVRKILGQSNKISYIYLAFSLYNNNLLNVTRWMTPVNLK